MISNSLELLTAISQSVFNPNLRMRGIHAGRPKLGSTGGGLVCAEIPIERKDAGAAGVLSVSVAPNCFVEGGPQWAVLVFRIAVEGGRYLDRASVFTGSDRLRSEFDEFLGAFLNAPAPEPAPSLRRSTVIAN